MNRMTPQLSVLLVEDDANVRLGCEQAMQLAGIAVTSVASAEEAQKQIVAGFPGVVVTDMRLPGTDGLAFVRWARGVEAALPVIMITGHGDVTLAVEAMRSGAYDFMQKPFSTGDLVDVVRRALEKRELVLEVDALRRRLDHRDDIESRLIGRSPQMAKVRQLILDVAGAAVDVLIFGETGTGKEMVARCLHDLAHPGQENYVALNCGGMSDNLLDSELFGHEPGAFTGAKGRRRGLMEQASGGTLFLDELGELPLELQVKLLKAIDDRQVRRLGGEREVAIDVQFIAASNRNLEDEVREGRFRADLYHRLSVFRLDLPSLRTRKADLRQLVPLFVREYNAKAGKRVRHIGEEVWRQLEAHDWPGNVRELRNVVERCVLFAEGEDFPGHWLQLEQAVARRAPADGLVLPLDGSMSLEAMERAIIEAALARAGGNVTAAARILGSTRETLRYRVEKFGLVESGGKG